MSDSLHLPSSRGQRFLDGVVTVSLVMMCAGIPLFFTAATMQGIAFDKMMYFAFWALLAVVAWAARAAIVGELTIHRTPLDYPIISLLAIMLGMAFFSSDAWHSLWGAFGDPSRGVLPTIAYAAIFVIIMTHGTMRRIQWMLGALIIAAGLVALWTFLGLLNIPFLPSAVAAHAPLSLIGTMKGLGVYLAMMLPLCITGVFVMWRESATHTWSRRIVIALLGIVIILILADLAMMFSYVPAIALMSGMAFFLVFVLSRIVRPGGSLAVIPMIVFVLISGAVIMGMGQIGLARVALPIEVAPGYQLSWDIARATLSDHFFFGYGPARYAEAFSAHRPIAFNEHPLFTLRFLQGEGSVFDALPTLGVIGTIMMLLVFLTYISVTLYLLSRDPAKNKMWSLGILTTVVIASIAAALQRLDGGVVLVGALVASLGMSVVYHESGVAPQRMTLSLKASPKFALTLAFISIVIISGVGMAFFSVGKVFVADLFAGKAVRSTEISDKSVEAIGRAIQLNDNEAQYYIQLGQQYMVLANREALKDEKERDLQQLRSHLDRSAESARFATIKSPRDVAVWEAYAQILENQSYYDTTLLDAVEKAYDEAGVREPANPLVAIKKGELTVRRAMLVDEKDVAKRKDFFGVAREHFGKAIAQKKNFDSAYYQRALVQQALGDKDAAIRDMEQAFVLSGQANMTYAFNLGLLYQDRGGENDVARAELLFRSILGVNDKEINTHFALASLYEKNQKYNEAIEEYRKVLDLLPSDATEAHTRVQGMITAIEQRGATPAAPSQQVATPESTQAVPTEQQAATNTENTGVTQEIPTTDSPVQEKL